jgi:hypothetical protein
MKIRISAEDVQFMNRDFRDTSSGSKPPSTATACHANLPGRRTSRLRRIFISS